MGISIKQLLAEMVRSKTSTSPEIRKVRPGIAGLALGSELAHCARTAMDQPNAALVLEGWLLATSIGTYKPVLRLSREQTNIASILIEVGDISLSIAVVEVISKLMEGTLIPFKVIPWREEVDSNEM